MIRDSPYWNSSSGVSDCWLFSPLLTIFWSFPTAKCLLCSQLRTLGFVKFGKMWKAACQKVLYARKRRWIRKHSQFVLFLNLSIEADWKGRWELIFKVHDLMSHQTPFIWSLHCNMIRTRRGGQHRRDNSSKLRDKVCILVIVYRFMELFPAIGRNKWRLQDRIAMLGFTSRWQRVQVWSLGKWLELESASILSKNKHYKISWLCPELKKKIQQESHFRRLFIFPPLYPVLTSPWAHASIQG